MSIKYLTKVTQHYISMIQVWDFVQKFVTFFSNDQAKKRFKSIW